MRDVGRLDDRTGPRHRGVGDRAARRSAADFGLADPSTSSVLDPGTRHQPSKLEAWLSEADLLVSLCYWFPQSWWMRHARHWLTSIRPVADLDRARGHGRRAARRCFTSARRSALPTPRSRTAASHGATRRHRCTCRRGRCSGRRRALRRSHIGGKTGGSASTGGIPERQADVVPRVPRCPATVVGAVGPRPA